MAQGTPTAILCDANGAENWMDVSVKEIVGADAGYYFGVNYSCTGDTVWSFDPSYGWSHLGNDIVQAETGK